MSEITESDMKDISDAYRYVCMQPGCSELTENAEGICNECIAVREACDAIPDLTDHGREFKEGASI